MEESKRLVELAEKELKEDKQKEQIDTIKKAVKQTLEKIEEKIGERNKLNKEIKTLKQDIENIRAGRLDLIEERQKKDEDAKRTSVIVVEKEKEVHHYYHDRWYEPYRIYWPEYYPYTISSDSYSLVTNSVAKDASIGTYSLTSGTAKYIN